MYRARLVSRLLIDTVALAIALFITPQASIAAPISSRLLIDPVGNDGDIFGSSVASVGDVNGDGYDDIVIGAHFYPSGAGQGQAYLYFGGPAMDPVADLVIAAPTGGAGWFGISAASAGDFNDDGYPDFIVGARNAMFTGKAFIYYGGPSLDATPDRTLTGEVAGSNSWFGNSVAPAGDVNGDGFDDVVVGAPAYGAGSTSVGRVYVFLGGSSPDTVPDRAFTGPATYDRLGWVVGSAGDMNGDGYADVFATAPRYYAGGTDPGAAYVWFGGPTSDTVADLTIHGTVLSERISDAAGDDFNGDGFSDLVITRENRAEVFCGGSHPNAVPDLTIPGAFGSVAGGDIDADGVSDIVLGASGDDTGGTDAGRVWVYFGAGALDAGEDLHFVGDGPNRFFGRNVATARRLDGTGPEDLIVAAAQLDPEELGYDSGRVYAYANSFETTAVPVAPAPGLVFLAPHPSPATSDVSLDLVLDHSVPVRITIYDVAGHEVARPVVDEWLAGRVTRTWRPRALASGVYYVRARLGDLEQVHKLVWLGRGR